MKRPMTDDQVEGEYTKLYPKMNAIEVCEIIWSSTSSKVCKKCGKRVFFDGDSTDLDMPANWVCPYCGKLILG